MMVDVWYVVMVLGIGWMLGLILGRYLLWEKSINLRDKMKSCKKCKHFNKEILFCNLHGCGVAIPILRICKDYVEG
jgi:hypothetical protein